MRRIELDKFLTVAVILIAGSVTIPSFAQQSLIQILSPASGLVVHPGQTVTITLAASSSVQKLVVVGQHPLGMARLAPGGVAGIVAQGQGDARAQQFLLTIPIGIQPGIYRVTALGRTSDGPVESDGLPLLSSGLTSPLEFGLSRPAFSSLMWGIEFRCVCWARLPMAHKRN